jgi:hypothetical protein
MPHPSADALQTIVSLADLTTTLAIESAMEAGRQDAYGDRRAAAARLKQLVTGAGVATSEVACLVEELDAGQRADAALAIAGLQATMASAAHAVQATGRFRECARALRHSARYLDGPLASVRP